VHTPLGIPAQAHYLPPQRADTLVHASDRLWDALAMLMIVSGTTLFVLARNRLASIAAGTHDLPSGVASYVQRADYFSAQSSLGLGMIGLGVVIGLVAAIRHALRRRSRGVPASPVA
jgi:hypothetical protein